MHFLFLFIASLTCTHSSKHVVLTSSLRCWTVAASWWRELILVILQVHPSGWHHFYASVLDEHCRTVISPSGIYHQVPYVWMILCNVAAWFHVGHCCSVGEISAHTPPSLQTLGIWPRQTPWWLCCCLWFCPLWPGLSLSCHWLSGALFGSRWVCCLFF